MNKGFNSKQFLNLMISRNKDSTGEKIYNNLDRPHKFEKDDSYFCKICGYNEYTGPHNVKSKYDKGQFWNEAYEYLGYKIDITQKLNKSKYFHFSVGEANKRLDRSGDPFPELNKFFVYSNSVKKWYIFCVLPPLDFNGDFFICIVEV